MTTISLQKNYHALFRTKLFNRIVLLFSMITIVTFCTLAILIYEYSTHSMLQKELNIQAEAVDSVTRYLDQKMDQSQEIVLQLYQNKALSDDMLRLLRFDLPIYIQRQVSDYISRNTSTSQEDSDTFFNRQVDHNKDILHIALYSHEQSFLYVYKKDKTQKFFKLKDRDSAITQAIERLHDQRTASLRTSEIDRLLENNMSGAYTFTFELNDPDTLKNAGLLMITFDPDGIQHVFENTRKRLMGNHLVLFPDGRVIYDSSNRYNGQMYPFMTKLVSTANPASLDIKAYKTTAYTAKSNMIVSGIVPASELANSYAGFKTRLIAITGICILITIAFTYMAVYRYAKRTRVIVKAMKQAQQGNLAVRIPTGRNDELDEISQRFNQMCEELMSYINQVYVSEIKQKHAELVAFQAQINPHFLYNTLEAIRMRAMTQGAPDAGEMAYVLGNLFRYAVKSDTIVTLEDEIDYCRQFLELYRIRYKDKIDYRITIDEKLKSSQLFKLTLQPLLENAIVHGIRSSGHPNLITISAYVVEDPSSLIVEVADNGKGMDSEKLKAVRETLACTDSELASQSLGLRNVHERIRLMHGNAYGLSIDSRRAEGTVVRVSLPY